MLTKDAEKKPIITFNVNVCVCANTHKKGNYLLIINHRRAATINIYNHHC